MKKSMLFFIIVIFVFILTACAGTNDWTFELPNGYELWRINSNEVIIKYTESEIGSEGIPSFIKEFSYDSRYVFSRNIKDISSNDVLKEVYYILDTQERKSYGPFDNVGEMQRKANELNAELPDKWYRTSPDPNLSK